MPRWLREEVRQHAAGGRPWQGIDAGYLASLHLPTEAEVEEAP